MTRFEKDLKDALAGNEVEVLTRRKAEIDKLTAEGKARKNLHRAGDRTADPRIQRNQREFLINAK